VAKGKGEIDQAYNTRLECDYDQAVEASLALTGSAIDKEAVDELPVVLDILGLRERIGRG
jgi:hypothetical protein